MRQHYLITTLVAACIDALPQQAPAGSSPAPSAPLPKGLGGLGKGLGKIPGFENVIASAMATLATLGKPLTEAGKDLAVGKPFPDVLDKTLPQLMNELKLHSRIESPDQQKLRPTALKKRAAFGPYKLVGKNDQRPMNEIFSLDPRGQGRVSYLPRGSFCDGKDCTILSARLGLTYEDGSEATPETGVYVHHLLSFVPGHPSTNAIGLCDVADPTKDLGVNARLPTQLPFAPFTGRGEDGVAVHFIFTSEDGKYDSGFHLSKNDFIFVQSDLVNYSNKSQNVYLTFDYEYLDGYQGISAITTLLSVTGCLLVVPPNVNQTGRAVTTSKKFPVMNDAVLLNIRGHMHDGGDLMSLAVNDKTVCESIPEYRADQLWSMSSCGKPIDIKKGDSITLTSVYDVTKHPMRSGVMDSHSHAKNVFGLNDLMGMFGVVFAAKPGPKMATPGPKSAKRN